MDERRHNRRDPWEPGLYETGRTRPPKSHGGLIALLLVIVIFLGGLVSVLGILNVRLFAKLQDQPDEPEDALSFISTVEETQAPPVHGEPLHRAPGMCHGGHRRSASALSRFGAQYPAGGRAFPAGDLHPQH